MQKFNLPISTLAILLLTACGTPQIKGQWQPIASPAIYFSGVTLPRDAVDKNYPDTCMEAQHEINRQLTQQLQKKIAPLKLYSQKPAVGSDYAELSMTITQCHIETDQTGDAFRFYLTLGTELTLTEKGHAVLRHKMTTHEQASSSTPMPLFEFTFANPVRNTLQLFAGAQVLIPQP